MFRADGRGGIQGIVIDSFYVDAYGRIANEFYIVTDSEEGQIEKLEPEHLHQLKDCGEVQKAFFNFFLRQKTIEHNQLLLK